MARSTRRTFVIDATALAGSAWIAPGLLRAQSAALSVTTLSDETIVVHGPDANAVVTRGDDGLIMVDGGHAAWTDALGTVVAERFGAESVRTLFNTHWHPEQTGANLRLGEAGAEIVAHENTRLWLGTEVWVRWSDIKYPPLPIAAQPTTTFYESGTLKRGGRDLSCGYLLNSHTDGDISIYLPDENVLVTGGCVSNDGWPVIDWWTGGWIAGMLDGFDALVATANADTRIVPATGPVMTLAELEAQRSMYETIFARLEDMLRRAFSTEEVLAERPTAEYDAEWGDSELFVTLAFQSMWGHLRDAYDRRMRNIA